MVGHFCYCVPTENRKLEDISVKVDENKLKFPVNFSASGSLYVFL